MRRFVFALVAVALSFIAVWAIVSRLNTGPPWQEANASFQIADQCAANDNVPDILVLTQLPTLDHAPALPAANMVALNELWHGYIAVVGGRSGVLTQHTTHVIDTRKEVTDVRALAWMILEDSFKT